jgi:glutamate 5-kinase
MEKPLLVLKVGTAAITRADGTPDEPVMVEMARQIAALHGQYRLVLVSSGAVGAGKRWIQGYSGQIPERKAAAAIGNPLLINKYAQFFAPYGIPIAQTLCERGHFARRKPFLQLRDTFQALWDNGVLPIANENDVVSDLELKFSDNDELATLIAVGFGADTLLLGTSVPGVLDAQGQVIPVLERMDAAALGLATREKSASGLGGMVSKLTFARLATRLGIRTVIFGVKAPEAILRALRGEAGTACLPQPSSLNARNKWLASGSLVIGRIEVNPGAHEALLRRSSLLAVGITAVLNDFERGEVVELALPGEPPFAVARARLSSEELLAQPGARGVEAAHADDIVLL